MGNKRKDNRRCKIYLYRREISHGLGVAWHWALNFVWEDGYEETYEAEKEDKTLRLVWREGEPEKCYDWKIWKGYRANSCSPREVKYQAERLCCVDRDYDFLLSNCQDFAKSLAKKFGVKLPPGLAKVVRTTLSLGIDNIIPH
ncbi:unnamed protein product [Meganyctiphanes norvegica]|uniref:Uncharacterized protein n=1 Tax=Meganyctiphanes norvegica TaxID=48144 RepID=A0AAV2Q8F3_MEGNR